MRQPAPDFTAAVKRQTVAFLPVVIFNKEKDKLLLLDFTEQNAELTPAVLADTTIFSHYINDKLQRANATYGIGGYNENRIIYSRSALFSSNINSLQQSQPEPRRLHLGIDIWGPAGTAVHAPLPATVHSFAYNNAFGDYGATIILQHETGGFSFHTLYGHLNLLSIQRLSEGREIEAGQAFAAFGAPNENGHWPPHLHFQIIVDMHGCKGDYPGVCAFSERENYLVNCPDPDLVLGLMRFATQQ